MLKNNSLVKIVPKFESAVKEYLVVINDLTLNELLFLQTIVESNYPFLLYVSYFGSVPVQLERCDPVKEELFKETNLPWLNKIARFRPLVERYKVLLSDSIKSDYKLNVFRFSSSLHCLTRRCVNEIMLKMLKDPAHKLYLLPKNTLNLVLAHVQVMTEKHNQICKDNVSSIEFMSDVARNVSKELEYWTTSFFKEYKQVNFFGVDKLNIDVNLMDIIQQYALPFTTPLDATLQCNYEADCWSTPTPYFSKDQLQFAVESKQDIKISWNTDKYEMNELLLPREYIHWISERLKTQTRSFQHIRFSSFWFPREFFNLSPCNCIYCEEDIDSDDSDYENSDHSCNK